MLQNIINNTAKATGLRFSVRQIMNDSKSGITSIGIKGQPTDTAKAFLRSYFPNSTLFIYSVEG